MTCIFHVVSTVLACSIGPDHHTLPYHHLSAVAAGVMHADALTLENAAASSAFFDMRGAHRAVVRAA